MDVILAALVEALQQESHQYRVPCAQLCAVDHQFRGGEANEIVLEHLEIPMGIALHPVTADDQRGAVPVRGEQFKSWGVLAHLYRYAPGR